MKRYGNTDAESDGIPDSDDPDFHLSDSDDDPDFNPIDKKVRVILKNRVHWNQIDDVGLLLLCCEHEHRTQVK